MKSIHNEPRYPRPPNVDSSVSRPNFISAPAGLAAGPPAQLTADRNEYPQTSGPRRAVSRSPLQARLTESLRPQKRQNHRFNEQPTEQSLQPVRLTSPEQVGESQQNLAPLDLDGPEADLLLQWLAYEDLPQDYSAATKNQNRRCRFSETQQIYLIPGNVRLSQIDEPENIRDQINSLMEDSLFSSIEEARDIVNRSSTAPGAPSQTDVTQSIKFYARRALENSEYMAELLMEHYSTVLDFHPPSLKKQHLEAVSNIYIPTIRFADALAQIANDAAEIPLLIKQAEIDTSRIYLHAHYRFASRQTKKISLYLQKISSDDPDFHTRIINMSWVSALSQVLNNGDSMRIAKDVRVATSRYFPPGPAQKEI